MKQGKEKIKIFYKVEGKGKVIILIQGLGYDHRPYLWLFERLKNHFRTIIFDNRGTGDTEIPSGPYTIEVMADDLNNLMQKLSIKKAVIMGISMGGYIAQMFALRYPQKVEKLILGCTYWSGHPDKIKMSKEVLKIIMEREGTVEEIARRGLAIAFSSQFPASHPDIFEKLVRWRVEKPTPARGYLGQLQAAVNFDIEDRIKDINVDVLVLHGDRDSVVAVEKGRALAKKMKRSKLKIIKGAGHLFFIEKPDETAEYIIEFVYGKKAKPTGTQRTATFTGKFHPYDFISSMSEIYPDRTALIDGKSGRKISYQQLNKISSKIACYLMKNGYGAGQRVGVLSYNSVEMVEVLFGCSKSALIFTPFNYRLNPEELKPIIKDASPSIIFVDRDCLPLFEKVKDVLAEEIEIILLENKNGGKSKKYTTLTDIVSEVNNDSKKIKLPPVDGTSPWIICYTGGTTGKPKGAILSHRAVIWNAVNTITGWGLRQDDIAPIFTPLFHTGGLNVLMTPLLMHGATAIIVKSFNPEKAFRIIKRFKATYVFMVPSMYKMMINSKMWKKETFTSVREFVTGGAPCPESIYREFAKKSLRFRMGYGLTEAGPNNFHLPPEQAFKYIGSIGKPLPFVEVKIDEINGSTNEGELLIRGPHLFSGYWMNEEETKNSFHHGWLKTGDIARLDSRGNYYITGRKKEMFISGGENIFPQEIEAILANHPAIDEVAVVGVPNEKWGEVGFAVIVLKRGQKATEEELKRFCRSRMAKYKVPEKFLFIEEMPKTGAGKIDKKSIIKSWEEKLEAP